MIDGRSEKRERESGKCEELGLGTGVEDLDRCQVTGTWGSDCSERQVKGDRWPGLWAGVRSPAEVDGARVK